VQESLRVPYMKTYFDGGCYEMATLKQR
jgi:hypothetical protein